MENYIEAGNRSLTHPVNHSVKRMLHTFSGGTLYTLVPAPHSF